MNSTRRCRLGTQKRRVSILGVSRQVGAVFAEAVTSSRESVAVKLIFGVTGNREMCLGEPRRGTIPPTSHPLCSICIAHGHRHLDSNVWTSL